MAFQAVVLFKGNSSVGNLSVREEGVVIESVDAKNAMTVEYSKMALHAYSLGHEDQPKPHILIQLLSEDEDEAGDEILIFLKSEEDVKNAFNQMNEFASRISEDAENAEPGNSWITAEDVVSP